MLLSGPMTLADLDTSCAHLPMRNGIGCSSIEGSEMHRFWVERKFGDGWKPVFGASSNAVQYCHGYIDAMDSVYPSAPYRLCKRSDGAMMKILRETKGHAKPHVN